MVRDYFKVMSVFVLIVFTLLQSGVSYSREREKAPARPTARVVTKAKKTFDPRKDEFELNRPVQLGDVGRPVDGEMVIVKVISETSVIVGLFYYNQMGLDPTAESKTYYVCIADYPTADMFDKRLYQCRQIFEVTGSVTFTKDNESLKIPLLKPVKKGNSNGP